MLKWPYTTPAGVPYKSTGSTNGQGTKGTFQRQLPEPPSGSQIKNLNKIIPDHVIRASHLSGSNGFDCDLDGADQIVDFKTLQTRTRTNTNPNDTEANSAGRSVRACVARKSKS